MRSEKNCPEGVSGGSSAAHTGVSAPAAAVLVPLHDVMSDAQYPTAGSLIASTRADIGACFTRTFTVARAKAWCILSHDEPSLCLTLTFRVNRCMQTSGQGGGV